MLRMHFETKANFNHKSPVGVSHPENLSLNHAHVFYECSVFFFFFFNIEVTTMWLRDS